MIPNVFVGSTIEDLHHLRDGIRETLDDLGYIPVMSEYGDIGYKPTTTVERSCYHSLVDCHLAVIIVGKRYGSMGLFPTMVRVLLKMSLIQPKNTEFL
jgi:hypothetical protein